MTTPRRRQIYKPHHVGHDAARHLDGDLSYGASQDVMSYLHLFRLWFACLTENLAESLAGNLAETVSQNLNRGFDYLRAFEAKSLQEAADIAADIMSGKTRAPALIPESARAPEAPKIMLSRSKRRMLARGLPACRQYGWFRYASSRTLSGNQFFELLGRLSVQGRVRIYRLEYKTRLCVRRPQNEVLDRGLSGSLCGGVSFGLCAAHLWPN